MLRLHRPRHRIEAVPLPDHSVDVVVSNCVINLSTDKDAVFTEAHRVLRPGGRLAIADVVADHGPDPALQADDVAWAACIAGAVTRDRDRDRTVLADVGFVDIEITDSHAVADAFWSVLVRATKPAAMGKPQVDSYSPLTSGPVILRCVSTAADAGAADAASQPAPSATATPTAATA